MEKSGSFTPRSAHDVRLIEEFVDALRRGHYAPKTIARYRCCVIQTARSLKRGIGALGREDVPIVVRRLFGRTACTQRMARGTLHTWLRFLGRFHRSNTSARW